MYLPNAFSCDRMCSLTIECVLRRQSAWGYQRLSPHPSLHLQGPSPHTAPAVHTAPCLLWATSPTCQRGPGPHTAPCLLPHTAWCLLWATSPTCQRGPMCSKWTSSSRWRVRAPFGGGRRACVCTHMCVGMF